MIRGRRDVSITFDRFSASFIILKNYPAVRDQRVVFQNERCFLVPHQTLNGKTRPTERHLEQNLSHNVPKIDGLGHVKVSPVACTTTMALPNLGGGKSRFGLFFLFFVDASSESFV